MVVPPGNEMIELMERLRVKYEQSNHDIGSFLKSLRVLTHAVQKTNGVDAEWLYEAARYHLNAKTKTYLGDKKIGLLAALLVGYGSSFNQAMLALCEWLDIGDTKVKAAYYSTCKEYGLPKNKDNLKNERFMKRAMPLACTMLIEYKAFPTKYERAHKAFMAAIYQTQVLAIEKVLFQEKQKIPNMAK